MEDVTSNEREQNIERELETLRENLSKLNTEEIQALRFYAQQFEKPGTPQGTNMHRRMQQKFKPFGTGRSTVISNLKGLKIGGQSPGLYSNCQRQIMNDRDINRAKSTLRDNLKKYSNLQVTEDDLPPQRTSRSPSPTIQTHHNRFGSLSRVDRGKVAKVLPVIGKYKANDLSKYLNVDPELILNPHVPTIPTSHLAASQNLRFQANPRFQTHLNSAQSSTIDPDTKTNPDYSMTPTILQEPIDNSIEDNKTQIRIDLNAALNNPEPLSPPEKSQEEQTFQSKKNSVMVTRKQAIKPFNDLALYISHRNQTQLDKLQKLETIEKIAPNDENLSKKYIPEQKKIVKQQMLLKPLYMKTYHEDMKARKFSQKTSSEKQNMDSSVNKIKLTHGPESKHEGQLLIGGSNSNITPKIIDSTPVSKGNISNSNSQSVWLTVQQAKGQTPLHHPSSKFSKQKTSNDDLPLESNEIPREGEQYQQDRLKLQQLDSSRRDMDFSSQQEDPKFQTLYSSPLQKNKDFSELVKKTSINVDSREQSKAEIHLDVQGRTQKPNQLNIVKIETYDQVKNYAQTPKAIPINQQSTSFPETQVRRNQKGKNLRIDLREIQAHTPKITSQRPSIRSKASNLNSINRDLESVSKSQERTPVSNHKAKISQKSSLRENNSRGSLFSSPNKYGDFTKTPELPLETDTLEKASNPGQAHLTRNLMPREGGIQIRSFQSFQNQQKSGRKQKSPVDREHNEQMLIQSGRSSQILPESPSITPSKLGFMTSLIQQPIPLNDLPNQKQQNWGDQSLHLGAITPAKDPSSKDQAPNSFFQTVPTTYRHQSKNEYKNEMDAEQIEFFRNLRMHSPPKIPNKLFVSQIEMAKYTESNREIVNDVIDTIHSKLNANTKLAQELEKGPKSDFEQSSPKSDAARTPETIHTKLRSSHMRSARQKNRVESDQMNLTHTSGQFGPDNKVLTPIKEKDRKFQKESVENFNQVRDSIQHSQEPGTPQSNLRGKGVYMQNQDTYVNRPTPDDVGASNVDQSSMEYGQEIVPDDISEAQEQNYENGETPNIAIRDQRGSVTPQIQVQFKIVGETGQILNAEGHQRSKGLDIKEQDQALLNAEKLSSHPITPINIEMGKLHTLPINSLNKNSNKNSKQNSSSFGPHKFRYKNTVSDVKKSTVNNKRAVLPKDLNQNSSIMTSLTPITKRTAQAKNYFQQKRKHSLQINGDGQQFQRMPPNFEFWSKSLVKNQMSLNQKSDTLDLREIMPLGKVDSKQVDCKLDTQGISGEYIYSHYGFNPATNRNWSITPQIVDQNFATDNLIQIQSFQVNPKKVKTIQNEKKEFSLVMIDEGQDDAQFKEQFIKNLRGEEKNHGSKQYLDQAMYSQKQGRRDAAQPIDKIYRKAKLNNSHINDDLAGTIHTATDSPTHSNFVISPQGSKLQQYKKPNPISLTLNQRNKTSNSQMATINLVQKTNKGTPAEFDLGQITNIKMKQPRKFGPIGGQEMNKSTSQDGGMNLTEQIVASPQNANENYEPATASIIPPETEYQSSVSPAPVHRTKIYGKFNIKQLVNPTEQALQSGDADIEHTYSGDIGQDDAIQNKELEDCAIDQKGQIIVLGSDVDNADNSRQNNIEQTLGTSIQKPSPQKYIEQDDQRIQTPTKNDTTYSQNNINSQVNSHIKLYQPEKRENSPIQNIYVMKRELNVPSIPQSQLDQISDQINSKKQDNRQRLFGYSGVMKKEDSVMNSSQTQKSQHFILQGQKDKMLNLSRENQKIKALRDLSKKSARIQEEERGSGPMSSQLYNNQSYHQKTEMNSISSINVNQTQKQDERKNAMAIYNYINQIDEQDTKLEDQSKELRSASGTPNETTTLVQIPHGSSKEVTVTDEHQIHLMTKDSIQPKLQFPIIHQPKKLTSQFDNEGRSNTQTPSFDVAGNKFGQQVFTQENGQRLSIQTGLQQMQVQKQVFQQRSLSVVNKAPPQLKLKDEQSKLYNQIMKRNQHLKSTLKGRNSSKNSNSPSQEETKALAMNSLYQYSLMPGRRGGPKQRSNITPASAQSKALEMRCQLMETQLQQLYNQNFKKATQEENDLFVSGKNMAKMQKSQDKKFQSIVQRRPSNMPNLIIGQPKLINTDLNQPIAELNTPEKKGLDEYNQLAQRVMSQYDKKFTLYNIGPSTGTLRSNNSLMLQSAAKNKDQSSVLIPNSSMAMNMQVHRVEHRDGDDDSETTKGNQTVMQSTRLSDRKNQKGMFQFGNQV